MTNWAELPEELLLLITQRLLSLSDQIRFSGVCSAWRLVGVEYRCHLPRQIPGLMISSSKTYDETCHFLRLPEARIYELAEFSVPHQIVCNGSTEGWMVVTDEFMQMHLLNPFSGAQLQLPSLTSLPFPFPGSKPMSIKYVEKAILSSNPILNADAFVLVIYNCGRLAFCKVGDETWTLIESPPDQWHLDAIYHKGNFFSVSNFGTLFVFDIGHQPKAKKIAPAPKSQTWTKRYLVELEGELLLIEREIMQDVEDFSSTDENDGDDDDDDDDDDDNNDNDGNANDDDDDDVSVESDSGYDAAKFGIITLSFKVYKLLSSERKWTRVKSIGNHAVFLGSNSSLSLSAMDFPALRGGCIYFTDDRTTDATDLQRGHDMGIYDMKKRTFEPLYPDSSQLMKPPPFWITPIPW